MSRPLRIEFPGTPDRSTPFWEGSNWVQPVGPLDNERLGHGGASGREGCQPRFPGRPVRQPRAKGVRIYTAFAAGALRSTDQFSYDSWIGPALLLRATSLEFLKPSLVPNL
jgi:hypothetical protein